LTSATRPFSRSSGDAEKFHGNPIDRPARPRTWARGQSRLSSWRKHTGENQMQIFSFWFILHKSER